MTLGMTINTNLESNMTALINLGIVLMPIIIMGLALIIMGEW
jgi:hypothetical protein